jgi:lambda repressor-like predicted transcriptional regulator
MRERCSLPTAKAWPDYGGRGIRVCKRWESFENFISDMGERPSVDYTIERENPNGNYEPRNCRWIPKAEQSRNRRNGRSYTLRGKTLSLKDWSKKTGIHYRALLTRHRRGWPAERALTRVIGAPRTALSYRNKTMTVTEWAAHSGMNIKTLRSRLDQGWSIAKALSTPVGNQV